MADLKEYAFTILETTTSVDMKTAAKTTLYTVPTGKTAYIMFVVVRDPSASLAGGTDYSFGTDAGCTNWTTAVNLAKLTSTSNFEVVGSTLYSEFAAASAFGIYPNTGSTATATATIDVIGFIK